MGIEGTLMHFMCQRLAAQKRKHRMFTTIPDTSKKAATPWGVAAEELVIGQTLFALNIEAKGLIFNIVCSTRGVTTPILAIIYTDKTASCGMFKIAASV